MEKQTQPKKLKRKLGRRIAIVVLAIVLVMVLFFSWALLTFGGYIPNYLKITSLEPLPREHLHIQYYTAEDGTRKPLTK